MQDNYVSPSEVAYVVADQSTNPADKSVARLVIDDQYFGANTWERYSVRWRAYKFRDSLVYPGGQKYIVFKELRSK